MELIKQYKENLERIDQLRETRDEKTEIIQKKIYALEYKIYWDRIRKLKDERDEKIRSLSERGEAQTKKLDKKIDKLHEHIARVDRIIYFLKLDKDKYTFNDKKLKPYSDDYFERLGRVYKDEFLEIKAYIVENDRPKNRYTLFVMGYCLFGSTERWKNTLLVLPYSYGMRINNHGVTSNIKAEIRHAPTAEELKQHFQKGNIINDFFPIEKYLEVKEEYLKVLSEHKLKEFKEIEKLRDKRS